MQVKYVFACVFIVWLTYCTKNGKTYNNDMNFKMPYFVVKVQRLVKEILEYAVFR